MPECELTLEPCHALTHQNGVENVIVTPLEFPWRTADPFLFCVHHDDAYPAGNELMGPAAPLDGREIGQDFAGKDGWRMYHGDTVPGFPQHPHRGFETVTILRSGVIDHSDSLGATARFGPGDTQWLTAGKGIVHAEMFPLLERERPNPLELFQIWLNLPRASKFANPYFSMFWRESAARHTAPGVEVQVVAGALEGTRAAPPPPESWAAHPDADLAIWTIKLAPEARWTLPPARPGTNRSLYLFRGAGLRIEDSEVPNGSRLELRPDFAAALRNGAQESQLLLLQGRPIGEPVEQYGPFVMNTPSEIRQAFADYQRTGFGGWRWPSDGPVHARGEERFARYPDGRVERAPTPLR